MLQHTEKEVVLRNLILVPIMFAAALAGPRFGGRVGYYSGNDPRTEDGGTSPSFGGQILLPLMEMVSVELSAGYASTETDIVMQDYLLNYIEEEEGVSFGGDIDSLRSYLEDEWGWTAPEEADLLENYTATFHDLDLAATLKINLPVGSMPIEPYIGGGGGAHIIVSDADLLIQYVEQQTGQGSPLDVYDKVHPSVHGVIGANFQPAMLPLGFFAEYRYARALGNEAASGAISTVYAGFNLGF